MPLTPAGLPSLSKPQGLPEGIIAAPACCITVITCLLLSQRAQQDPQLARAPAPHHRHQHHQRRRERLQKDRGTASHRAELRCASYGSVGEPAVRAVWWQHAVARIRGHRQGTRVDGCVACGSLCAPWQLQPDTLASATGAASPAVPFSRLFVSFLPQCGNSSGTT